MQPQPIHSGRHNIVVDEERFGSTKSGVLDVRWPPPMWAKNGNATEMLVPVPGANFRALGLARDCGS